MNNSLRLPWAVMYDEYHNGEKFVNKIVDCDNREVVETDCGVYPPSSEQAEAIVTAVNVYFRNHYE
ncbi:hypothetical protein HOO68_06120 [Candidatus Gracilibacteria bacterium]|nr:hypothetical protein [Candidatus Gracilibacteria bacterium]